jgi:polar amino acid transport system substrate-binding protein
MTVGQTVLLNARHEQAVKSYRDLDDSVYTVVSKPGTTGEAAVLKMIPKATYMPANTEMEGAMRVLEGTADAFVYDFPSTPCSRPCIRPPVSFFSTSRLQRSRLPGPFEK